MREGYFGKGWKRAFAWLPVKVFEQELEPPRRIWLKHYWLSKAVYYCPEKGTGDFVHRLRMAGETPVSKLGPAIHDVMNGWPRHAHD